MTLPEPLAEGTKVALEIVDDVTGLAFNPQRYELTQSDNLNYFVNLPFVIGSVVKYRYIRLSDMNTIEYSPMGQQVRFRMALITGPAIFQDNVAAWIDQVYGGVIGRVRGQFLDNVSNSPIPNLLVTAEGMQTVTAADGTFTLEGLSPGTHNLVAYSMDGQYETFQQGVRIAEESTTPVFISLTKRETVSVTIEVNTPADFDVSIPVRFASNLQTLGNLYTDLYSGSTTVAANLPELTRIKDGKYSLTVDLPAGFDLRYKFTLGDGLWNSELDSDGNFVLRQWIVNADKTTIVNTINTFRSKGLEPVTFNVTTPLVTPTNDDVSIQFNPFGWFEPIPMVRQGNNQWTYTLYSPLNILGEVTYRFCRNEQCDLTSGITATDQVFYPSANAQSFSVNIEQWSNYGLSYEENIITEGGAVSPRPYYLTGFELTTEYRPNTNNYLDGAFAGMVSDGANTVVIPCTWSATRNTPPYLEPRPGIDYSWSEMQTTIQKAKASGLQVVLFPLVTFPQGADVYWDSARRDEGWWITWYESYHRYMMQIVSWASANGVDAIIVGDPGLSPSFTDGLLANGNSAKSPGDADEQWRQLIRDIRTGYSGMILGAVAYPSSQEAVPGWLDSVDEIYALYSPSLSQSSGASVQDLISIISQDLEENFYPPIEDLGKSIIITINYPSSSNAFIGCTDTLGSCLNDWGYSQQVDLDVQSRIYNAAVIVASKETWVSGFFSRNYLPDVSLHDGSASINGKPAFDVLWFWYHYILDISP